MLTKNRHFSHRSFTKRSVLRWVSPPRAADPWKFSELSMYFLKTSRTVASAVNATAVFDSTHRQTPLPELVLTLSDLHFFMELL